ncbi:MAG TPA: hypothetical protein VG961_01480 [Ignavibacteria bacterium]|nr:hypothetical protein [Ignavibacteria bacterium]
MFEEIELFLTADELSQLSSYANELIERPSIHHVHLSENMDSGNSKEITVAIVTDDNLDEFDERSREVISKNQ